MSDFPPPPGMLTIYREGPACALAPWPEFSRSRGRNRFLRALPEFFGDRAEFSFWRGNTDRKRFRLRNEMQEFHAVSETVAINVPTNGDAGSRFDG